MRKTPSGKGASPPQGVGSQGIILDIIKQLGTRRRLRIFHPIGQVLQNFLVFGAELELIGKALQTLHHRPGLMLVLGRGGWFLGCHDLIHGISGRQDPVDFISLQRRGHDKVAGQQADKT